MRGRAITVAAITMTIRRSTRETDLRHLSCFARVLDLSLVTPWPWLFLWISNDMMFCSSSIVEPMTSNTTLLSPIKDRGFTELLAAAIVHSSRTNMHRGIHLHCAALVASQKCRAITKVTVKTCTLNQVLTLWHHRGGWDYKETHLGIKLSILTKQARSNVNRIYWLPYTSPCVHLGVHVVCVHNMSRLFQFHYAMHLYSQNIFLLWA